MSLIACFLQLTIDTNRVIIALTEDSKPSFSGLPSEVIGPWQLLLLASC